MSRRALEDELRQAQAEGRISEEDVEEVTRFADFLRATGHLPPPSERTAEQRVEASQIYLEHYPEHRGTR